MLISRKEAELLHTLQQTVNKVIKRIMLREAIHRKSEGRVSIEFSSMLEGQDLVTVTLDSYLMSDFDIKTDWTSNSLEKALLKALHDVIKWSKLEEDSVSSNFSVDNL